jgi:hypothetical protein
MKEMVTGATGLIGGSRLRTIAPSGTKETPQGGSSPLGSRGWTSAVKRAGGRRDERGPDSVAAGAPEEAERSGYSFEHPELAGALSAVLASATPGKAA